MPDEFCIEVENLSKSYNTHKVLKDISFKVEYGTIFGYLGTNGAGKTTTIKILTGLLKPTSGNILIFGKNMLKNSIDVRKRIGVVSQQPSFESNLDVEKSLELYGFLWGLSRNNLIDRIGELTEVFNLESFIKSKHAELSIGQRRRVQVAREFLHDMDLLFLDEPTVGLDPQARRNLLNYIKKRVNDGLTVFFTTHIMEEAEYLCNYTTIINDGKIIEFDTPESLKQKYGKVEKIEFHLNDPVTITLYDQLKNMLTNEEHIEYNHDIVTITFNSNHEILIKSIKIFLENKFVINKILMKPPTLEDIFLKIVNNISEKKD